MAQVRDRPAKARHAMVAETRRPPILRLQGLSKAFGDQVVLEDFSIEVGRGEFLTLLGPSGCGKSTTLNLIAGFIQPDAGQIILRDRPANRLPPQKRRLGMVFQSWALFPHMKVFDNVAYGLRTRAAPGPEIARRVEDILRLVRLPDAGEKYPSQLSGGMQQRVALARALVTEPDVLLLDEPLSNLDAALRKEMEVELKRIHDHLQVTTLLVTHSQEEALVMSDRVAVMQKGRIEQIATPWEIYNRPKTRFICTFLGDANIIEGTVETRTAQDVVVRAGSLALKVKDERDRLRPGERIELGLRPENIQIADGRSTTTDNLIPAVVTDVIFKGSNVTYYLRAGDQELLALTLPWMSERLHKEGEHVELMCSKSSFLILDREPRGDG